MEQSTFLGLPFLTPPNPLYTHICTPSKEDAASAQSQDQCRNKMNGIMAKKIPQLVK
jgi:hypothetical protein